MNTHVPATPRRAPLASNPAASRPLASNPRIHAPPPEHPHARLVRFTDGWDMFPTSNVVAVLNQKENVLHVQRALYDRLPEHEQRRVLFTEAPFVEVRTTGHDDFPGA